MIFLKGKCICTTLENLAIVSKVLVFVKLLVPFANNISYISWKFVA